jgi:hypothetical protein
VAGCAFSLLIVPGCGGGKRSSPEKAAKTYLAAAREQDLDAMLAGCAPDMREMLDGLIKSAGKQNVLNLLPGAGKLEKFKILGTKTEGDWAEVEASLTVNGKEQRQTISFHNINGEWLLDMPDEDKDRMKVAVEMMKDPSKAERIMGLLKGTRPAQPEPATKAADDKPVEEAVQKYLAAVKAKDFKAMLACFAPETRELFEEMAAIEGEQSVRERLAHGSGTFEKVELSGTRFRGDWADVGVALTVDGRLINDVYSLRNIDGKWLFDLPDGQKQGMKLMLQMMKRDAGKVEKMKRGMPDTR